MTRRALSAALFALAAVFGGAVRPAIAQDGERAGLPGTDVYLAALDWTADGPALGPFENVTANPGYDNQPAFAPDGASFLYTRQSMTGGTDIWRYDLESGRPSPVLVTPNASEFSPQQPFGDARIAVVRQDGAGAQRLFAFDPGGPHFRPLTEFAGLGYYAMAADQSLIAGFILGAPPTLEVQPLPDGRRRAVAADIARTLVPAPQGGVLYASRTEDGGFLLQRLASAGRAPQALFPLPGQTQDFAASQGPDGGVLLWSVSDGVLFVRALDVDDDWRRLLALEPLGLVDASRVAVSPTLDHIALVARD